MWFLQEVSLQCLNMHIAVAPRWSLENKKLSPCLSRIPSAAAGPVLVPFSINFTIINLEFEEEMGHPGSRKFNIMDRTLQSLVRVPLSASSPTYWPCPALLLEEATAHLILTIHKQIQLTMPALLSSLLSWLYPSLLLFTFLLSPQFRPLFSKTSVGPLYSGCRLTLLRWVFSRLELLKVLSVQGLCSDSSPHSECLMHRWIWEVSYLAPKCLLILPFVPQFINRLEHLLLFHFEFPPSSPYLEINEHFLWTLKLPHTISLKTNMPFLLPNVDLWCPKRYSSNVSFVTSPFPITFTCLFDSCNW